MKELTNTEKAGIVFELAGAWMAFWNDDIDFHHFLRIVDGAFAMAEAEVSSGVPWCKATGKLKGFCIGCEHNEYPWSGDPLGCAELPTEVNDLLIKLDQAKSFPKT